MTQATERIDLQVPFPEKDEAKALGAKFDPSVKRWYIPPGSPIEPFRRWLPEGSGVAVAPADSGVDSEEPGVALSALLARAQSSIRRAFPSAEWVRAEIASVNRRQGGHVFLDLVEHREGDSRQIAKAGAALWSDKAAAITGKFQKETGSTLEAGMRVLLLVKVDFTPMYGLRLVVEDIDPRFTLGDLEARRRQIRETLSAEGVFERNRELRLPEDFTRVAVLSPESAAGLGDFMREAGLLQHHALCEFVYFTAVFQGEQAVRTLPSTLASIAEAHRERPFDALAVIRGGGAALDLAWLDQLEITRAVCTSPVPVITGIGHERDNTLLDEVACRRFDTPSKVSGHFFSTITGNAQQAQRDFESVVAAARSRLSAARAWLRDSRVVLQSGSSQCVARARHWTREGRRELGHAAYRLPAQGARLAQECWSGVVRESRHDLHTARRFVRECGRQATRSAYQLPHRARSMVVHEQERVRAYSLGPLRRLRDAARHEMNEIGSRARRMVRAGETAAGRLDAAARVDAARALRLGRSLAERDYRDIQGRSEGLVRWARDDLKLRFSLVMSQGPKATLQRGFALVRDPDDGAVIPDAAAAGARPRLRLDFRDGSIEAEPQHSNGDGND